MPIVLHEVGHPIVFKLMNRFIEMVFLGGSPGGVGYRKIELLNDMDMTDTAQSQPIDTMKDFGHPLTKPD